MSRFNPNDGGRQGVQGPCPNAFSVAVIATRQRLHNLGRDIVVVVLQSLEQHREDCLNLLFLDHRSLSPGIGPVNRKLRDVLEEFATKKEGRS
jgi:hypothetical protein